MLTSIFSMKSFVALVDGAFLLPFSVTRHRFRRAVDGGKLGRTRLVVDDSRTVRVRVRRLLEGAEDFNFNVSEAADGSEALKLLEKTAIDRLPDVIPLDRNMPRVSGDACIRILKSGPVWKTIPVIFLTAQTDKAEVRREQ